LNKQEFPILPFRRQAFPTARLLAFLPVVFTFGTDACARSVTQAQITKHFAPDTVQVHLDHTSAGLPEQQTGETVDITMVLTSKGIGVADNIVVSDAIIGSSKLAIVRKS